MVHFSIFTDHGKCQHDGGQDGHERGHSCAFLVPWGLHQKVVARGGLVVMPCLKGTAETAALVL